MLRIISKKEVYTEAKSSLAGTCAVRLYIDGNITFSRQASDLMDFENNPYFMLATDNETFYLVPNPKEGYKPSQRNGKYTFVLNSKPICNYLSNIFGLKPEARKPLEFKIEESKHKIKGVPAYKLVIPENNH